MSAPLSDKPLRSRMIRAQTELVWKLVNALNGDVAVDINFV